MARIESSGTPQGGGRGKIIAGVIIVAAVAGASGYYFAGRHADNVAQKSTTPTGAPMSSDEMAKRSQAYKEAIVASTTHPLPTTPEEVITEFWTAASHNDTDAMVRLCPGSMKTDYVAFSKYVPSPPKSIGAGEPHPTAKGVTVYPVTITYSKGTEKVYKMAVTKTPDGHYSIDGLHTVWK